MNRRLVSDRDWVVLALIVVLAAMLVVSNVQDVILERQRKALRECGERLERCQPPLVREVDTR